MRLTSLGIHIVSIVFFVCIATSREVRSVEFNRDIRPILAQKCFACHGPDEASREAELRLDLARGEQSAFHQRDGYRVLVPGDAAASELWRRLTTSDEDERMPPATSHKEPLTADQLELVRSWIEAGAEYETFWAFARPRSQVLPDTNDKTSGNNRIDSFIQARLEREGLAAQRRADKRTLIRRVTLDLTGLPPTREQISAYLADKSPDAFQRVVDRLLASPHYGEHMAKYWLDLVRFADTNGIHHDHYREMTPYRDWVIQAFNDNLPFNHFVVYQLAGDLFESPTVDQLIASGFNRLHLVIDKGTAIPEESFARNVIDRVTAVGTAFMGLTVGCAVCHDHKYDPVTQKDFYQLYAFFNNIDSPPETPGRSLHPPFLRLPSQAQQARLVQLEERIADASSLLEQLREAVAACAQDVQATGADDGSQSDQDARSQLTAAEERLKQLQDTKSKFEETIPVTLIMKERNEVRPTRILIRGAYDQPGEPVGRGTPAFLPPLQPTGDVATRMDLALWLTDPRHPLTARVVVNRIWQQFFGKGIVKTSEDFGTQGEWPSHPALLDELATAFVDSGWNVKRLVRSVVSSRAYQRSSQVTQASREADPENRLLSRGARFRLDAEMIRDQLLFVSGLLNKKMYGKSVKPPQPPNLWKNVSMVSSSTYSFTADEGAKILRRSLYSFWKRALPPPQMTIFDAPTREACTARRERTNTPLQALVLMNEGQYFKAAKNLAHRVLAMPALHDDQRLQVVYESITSQLPDDGEMQALQGGLQGFREHYRRNPEMVVGMTEETDDLDVAERIEVASYTMLVNALFNLDITKTRQ